MLITRTLSISVVLLLLLAGVFAPASSRTTYANADYDRSEPAADAYVAASPATVKVWFIEAVDQGSWISVLNADAEAVDLGDSTIDSSDPDSKLLVVSLNPDLPEGAYTVKWMTLSAVDGDEVTSEFTFNVGTMMSGDMSGDMSDDMSGDMSGDMKDGDMSGDMPATLPNTGDDATVPAAAGMVVFGLLALAAGLTIRKVSLTSR